MQKTGFFFLTFLCFQYLTAQVQVSLEPRHHLVFSNTHVRILDVHIPPGDTSQFHIHSTPSIFLVLNSVKTGSEVIQEEDHSGSPIPHYGDMWFEGFYQQSRIHRVWNTDSAEFRVMDIELPNKNYIPIDSPISRPDFTFIVEEKPVRAYWLNPSPGEEISISPRKADVLVILMTNPVQAVQVNGKAFLAKGDYHYVPAGKTILIKNGNPQNIRFLFLELK